MKRTIESDSLPPIVLFPDLLGHSIRDLGPLILWHQKLGVRRPGFTDQELKDGVLDSFDAISKQTLQSQFELRSALDLAFQTMQNVLSWFNENNDIFKAIAPTLSIAADSIIDATPRAYSITADLSRSLYCDSPMRHFGAFHYIDTTHIAAHAFHRRCHELLKINNHDAKLTAKSLQDRANELKIPNINIYDTLLMDSLFHEIIFGYRFGKISTLTTIRSSRSITSHIAEHFVNTDCDPPANWKADQLAWYMYQQIVSEQIGKMDNATTAESIVAIALTKKKQIESIKKVLAAQATEIVNDSGIKDVEVATKALLDKNLSEISELISMDSRQLSRVKDALTTDAVFIASAASMIAATTAGLGSIALSSALITFGSRILVAVNKSKIDLRDILDKSPWQLIYTLHRDIH